MRIITLIIAGSVVAACGGPRDDASSNQNAKLPEVAELGEAIIHEPAEPQGAPGVAAAGGNGEVDKVSPCLMQGAGRLRVAAIRVVGTEPFWAAQVEGRCITYTSPDNLKGVRVWTRYADEGHGRSRWTGELGGKTFELSLRPADCSDGMSDRIYPIAADLTIMGESRSGCAAPL